MLRTIQRALFSRGAEQPLLPEPNGWVTAFYDAVVAAQPGEGQMNVGAFDSRREKDQKVDSTRARLVAVLENRGASPEIVAFARQLSFATLRYQIDRANKKIVESIDWSQAVRNLADEDPAAVFASSLEPVETIRGGAPSKSTFGVFDKLEPQLRKKFEGVALYALRLDEARRTIGLLAREMADKMPAEIKTQVLVEAARRDVASKTQGLSVHFPDSYGQPE
jgi:hypothetical protein